jgi:hypothetical protein
MPATLHVVQSFKLNKNHLKLDQERSFRTEAEAVTVAKRLAITKAGVMAYSAAVDVKADIYGDPKILFCAGRLPPGPVGQS